MTQTERLRLEHRHRRKLDEISDSANLSTKKKGLPLSFVCSIYNSTSLTIYADITLINETPV